MVFLKKTVIKKNIVITLLLLLLITFSGFSLEYFMAMSVSSEKQPDSTQPADVDFYFNDAIELMTNKQYQQAVVKWQQLLQLKPTMPEAHVNLGFSLFEVAQYQQALKHFERAMELNPYQTNAYYGLAICYEKLGRLAAASGAMRSYVHLSKKDDPFVRKAQSALWEWQEQQKRETTITK